MAAVLHADGRATVRTEVVDATVPVVTDLGDSFETVKIDVSTNRDGADRAADLGLS